MTKKEIVRTISEEIGLTQLQTKEIVQKTFNAIVEALVEEGRIELRNFGVFEVKRRAPRKARNPRTGDKVFVPEKFVVTFKPGKEMEERVRELELQAAAAAKASRTKTASPAPPRVRVPRASAPRRRMALHPQDPDRRPRHRSTTPSCSFSYARLFFQVTTSTFHWFPSHGGVSYAIGMSRHCARSLGRHNHRVHDPRLTRATLSGERPS